MDFNEFADWARESVADYLTEYELEDIRLDYITKNNGVKLCALIICPKGKNVVPNIYLDYYYELYQRGKLMEDILVMIRDEYKEAYENFSGDVISEHDIFGDKDKIFINLINQKRNGELLKNIPYIPFNDLAVTFRYLIDINDKGITSVIMDNRQYKKLNITKDELYSLARKNTKRLFPVRYMHITAGKVYEGTAEPSHMPELLAITNNKCMNGAVYMVYQEVLDECFEASGESFYIVPSSIHEIILVPLSMLDNPDDFIKTIKLVNETSVDSTDYLSDNLYYYDSGKKTVGIYTPVYTV